MSAAHPQLQGDRGHGGPGGMTAPAARAVPPAPTAAGRPVPWGLYVHLPFCPYKCAYCDFVAVAGGARVARWQVLYVEAVLREAAEWQARLRPGPPASVFYGGGTPTAVATELLTRLHRALCARFAVPPDAEVTVECNPGTVDGACLRSLRAAGVNRLSIGLQAAQDRLLAALGRRHGWTEFLAAYRAARAAGLEHVNVDVMYGLPGQDRADLADTLDRVCALRPEHVSAYGLQLEPGTPLHARVRRGQVRLPDEDEAAEQFALCRERLAAAGYEHYEISNFAQPGHRSRHNLLYWTHADYLGLGIGAHSHWQGRRWANTTRLAVYCAAGDGPARMAAQEPEDPARERSEGAFLGLRLLDGLDEAEYERRYGVPLRAAFPGAVERLIARGLLEEAAPGRLRLTPTAVPIANLVFAEFV